MSAPAGLSTGSNPSWSLTIWNKVHRYRCLLTKYWWVMLLTVSFALCVTAYFQMNKPPTFVSTAKLSINLENRPVLTGDTAGGVSQDLDSLMATQITIITTSTCLTRSNPDCRWCFHAHCAGPCTCSATRMTRT